MSNHVPGPWTVETCTTNGRERLVVWHEYTDGDGGIDEICDIQMDYSNGIAQANAKLIASAPEMLEALRAIAMIGGNLPDDRLTGATGPNDAERRGIMYTEARRIARAAITEATCEPAVTR